MTATTRDECNVTNTSTLRLLMAMELARREWKLGFTTGPGQPLRRRTLSTRSWQLLPTEIALAKRRFGLPVDIPVTSCYEAGRDGFWIHRYLTTLRVENLIVEPASIEVNRRARRAKTDRLDLEKLASMLGRYVGGERTVWRLVRVPSEAAEDRRQPPRELATLKRDRTRITNRIQGLLATVGAAVRLQPGSPLSLDEVTQWNGAPLPEALRARLAREWETVELLTTRMHELERARRAALHDRDDATVAMVRRLLQLRGIGANAAWLFVTELFAWRQFKNTREIGGLTGLVGTPYQSGTFDRDQGISKAGNRHVRAIAIQIAWGWLTFQPESALTRWYHRRFAQAGPDARKIGIVAVARRLLIELWRYLQTGVLPKGAVLKEPGEVEIVMA